MHRLLVVSGLALVAACASGPKPQPASALERAAPEHPPFLDPQQILKRLEDSETAYQVEGRDSPPGGWAEKLWPQQVPAREAPKVLEHDGVKSIIEWPVHPEAQALLQEAEPLFQARRYDDAAKLYEKATTVCPDCYVAWNFRGDAAFFSGDSVTALKFYRKALSLNPDDHRTWFFQGNALARLGRYKEALDSWAWCLVLNPRYPIIRQFFRTNSELGLVIREDAIVPRGYAERAGNVISVQFDPDHDPSWLAFANCKALWLGEPSHRQEMTGSTNEHYTTVEELECLGSALIVHENQRSGGKTDNLDPTLARLAAITRDGMLSNAVLFEVGARIHPQVMLTLDDAVRQELKAYVLKHVLVPVASADDIDL
ncbi:tetratricopeptide repeat protein [Myxococcus sp. K15C18031901]|uniref:tetratricopeptide repeat protein n=1 Tax=Myxococcus dinghuensis TaxID=2906761 RepID=UPI0020A74D7C|nr:tetratricopeptide repeat protein [Myxococcus dinghuensis]MCP3101850.1 tetratricopeptide repeat protein [Myxococcus dinghuensis]